MSNDTRVRSRVGAAEMAWDAMAWRGRLPGFCAGAVQQNKVGISPMLFAGAVARRACEAHFSRRGRRGFTARGKVDHRSRVAILYK
ncbi:hypothetical protein LBW46_23265, partial [Ralstonia solanacearum]|uniref:hypothetical protein n=2 Tax=Ralstonia solanacearum TaxID=305 RepID=UPI001CF4B9C5